jgi:hypothetical protein
MSNDADKTKTLLHELAHVLLGHTHPDTRKERATGEVEAEAVTSLILLYFDIDFQLSREYIQSWRNTAIADDIDKTKILSVTEKIIKNIKKQEEKNA